MGALDGLRVLDLSPTRVGAQVSQVLADFGAEVTWVEPPGGAELRGHAAFPFWARGKRSIAVDIHDDADRDVIRQLAARADVLIETFRPGVLDGFGLGFEAVSPSNPRLVYCSITGFGRQGPYAGIQGHEGVVLAKLGVFGAFWRMGGLDHPPFVTVPFAVFPASQTALHGILAVLHEREHSGLGQWVESNLAEGFLTLDTWGWFEHIVSEKWPDAFRRSEMFDEDGRPAGPFPLFLLVALTKDGTWLQFASVAPHLYAATLKAMGLDWMFTDEAWKGIPMFDDNDVRAACWSKMLEAANQKTVAEWNAIFDTDPNVFAELFRGGPAILEHPQLLHDRGVVEIDDAERGRVRQPGPLVAMSATPAELGASAPRLDEHRAAVLAQLVPGLVPGLDAGAATTPPTTPPTGRGGAAPSGLPLDGITILELAVLFAAPHGTTMLTDLGARVIKVEPLAGDPIRMMITFPESGGAKVMQGKESICVDITTPEGRAIVLEIAEHADVVMQGFRAGATTRLGLDYPSLRAINPDVVYVNAPGYGVDGPYGARPAYAPSIGAATGIALTNVGDSVPEQAGQSLDEIKLGSRRLSGATAIVNAQSDGFAALGVATAILLGLVARDRQGCGQELWTSMLNTGAHALSAQAVDHPGSPGEPAPDRQLRGLGALYRTYDTTDGWIFLAAPSARDWDRLSAALAPHADLRADDRFGHTDLRTAHDGALAEALSAIFRSGSSQRWERELRSAGVACVEVTTTGIEPLLFSNVGRESGYLVDVHHPTFDDHPRLAPFVRLSRSATQARPGVLAGSATDAILVELGRSAEEVSDLRARQIVG